jgi:hypothetical protein
LYVSVSTIDTCRRGRRSRERLVLSLRRPISLTFLALLMFRFGLLAPNTPPRRPIVLGSRKHAERATGRRALSELSLYLCGEQQGRGEMAEGIAALDHHRVAQSVHREAIPAVLAEPRSAKLLRSAFYWLVTMLLFATGSLVYLLAERDESTRLAKALEDPALRFVATSPRTSPARPTPSNPREAAHVKSLLHSAHPKPPEQLRSPNSTTTTTATTTTNETSILHQSPTSILLHQSSPETPNATTALSSQPERPSNARTASSSSKKKLECTATLMADGVSFSYHCR